MGQIIDGGYPTRMRLHVPVLRLADGEPSPGRLVDQFGGIPWGLPTDRWPRCSSCGRGQSLIAQLVHAPDRLDLGAKGRALFVFRCTECDDFSEWSDPPSVRSAFVVEPGDLLGDPSTPPEDVGPPLLCIRATDWEPADDGIEPEEVADFLDLGRFEERELWNDDRVLGDTRLGGVPKWHLGGPEGAPQPPWRFALQIDPPFHMTGALPDADALGCYLVRNSGREQQVRSPRRPRPGVPCHIYVSAAGWSCDGPTFADGGGWVFLRTNGSDVPQARFSWARS